jgi:YD repeat-containing protein
MNFRFICLLSTLLACIGYRSGARPANQEDDSIVQISSSPAFYQELVPIGTPAGNENSALLAIIQNMRAHGVVTNLPALEQFVSNYPVSPWTLSLRANLGRYYYEHGRYSLALQILQDVWQQTGQATEGPAKRVADFTFAYLTRALASLGRLETLLTLFKQTEGRVFDSGPLQQIVNSSSESCLIMQIQPGISFQCGTFAIKSLADYVIGDSFNSRPLLDVPSPTNGFNMSTLLSLAAASRVDLVAGQWGQDMAIVVPSIVHWKSDHYAAILNGTNGVYRVVDPTFGKERWLGEAVIREEASGQFLVLRGSLPESWRLLSAQETDQIWGRGYVYGANDPNDGCGNGSGGASPPGTGGSGPGSPTAGTPTAGAGSGGANHQEGTSGAGMNAGVLPGDGGGGNCASGCNGGGNGSGGNAPGSGGSGSCPNCPAPGSPGASGGNSGPSQPGLPAGATSYRPGGMGMATWEVSEPYITLWLYDKPLAYQSGVGYPVSLTLAYKQRETRLISTNVFSFGKMWDSSWLSYIPDTYPGEQATRENLGGGEVVFYDMNNVFYHEHTSRSQLERTTHTDTSLAGFVVEYPSGAKDVYGYVIPFQMVDTTFLTAQVDPFGHTNRFDYDETSGALLLKYVVDADGRTNQLFYTNLNFPAQVTSVEDAFGRTTWLKYDETGMLTNIVDPVGLASSFKYDWHGWATNLTTPYGTTTFEHFTNSYTTGNEFVGDSYLFVRACRVVDPVGATNLYMLRQDCLNLYTNLAAYSNGITTPFLADGYLDGTGHDDLTIIPSNLPAVYFTPLNQYLRYRNSFHWGPRQASQLPTDLFNFSVADYRKARLRHWLHDANINLIGQSLALEQAASVDGLTPGQTTWYFYPGVGNGPAGPSVPYPNLVARVLPDGTSAYEWTRLDEWDNVTNIVSSHSTGFGATVLSRTNVYIYDSSSHDLIQEIGQHGETNGYFYDANHQLLRYTNAVGEITCYTYDDQGRLTNTLTPSLLNIQNVYFSSGDYTNWVEKRIELEIGRTNSFTYATNLVATQTDPRGNVTSYTYDNLQRLRTASDARGTVTYAYDKLDLSSIHDRLSLTTSFVHDGVRRLTAKTNALGYFTLYNYCTCGALDSLRDAEGNYTFFFYDNLGRLLNAAYPDGYSVTNNFNLLGQLTNTIDSAGVSITNWFDNQGLRYAVADAVGTREFISFDDEDRATNIVNSDGVSIGMSYDNLGRMVRRKYPDAGVEKFGYSSSGLVAYTNQIGMSNYFVYDEGGRKIFETNANAELIRYTNNHAGDLLSLTDGKSQTTRWNYDEYGRVTNKVDQAGTVTLRYAYDADDRLTNRWSVEKGNTGYGYDNAGNLTGIAYAHSASVSFAYDAMNRRTNMVDGIGTTAWAYTPAGQVFAEDGPFASDTLTNSYENRRRLGLRLQQPTGTWTNGFGYDLANRLTNVIMSAGTFAYKYGTTGVTRRPLKISLPNSGYITNIYDPSARLLETSLDTSGDSVLDSYLYAYNPASQRTNVARADSSTVAYSYDRIGQLTGADSSIAAEDRAYDYDSAWNLNHRTRNGTTDTFLVNPLNELTNALATTLIYDQNGNLTNHGGQVYAYDDENRLITWSQGLLFRALWELPSLTMAWAACGAGANLSGTARPMCCKRQ